MYRWLIAPTGFALETVVWAQAQDTIAPKGSIHSNMSSLHPVWPLLFDQEGLRSARRQWRRAPLWF